MIINDYIVQFGYGDILVDYTCRGLRFREINKPQVVGNLALDDLETGKVALTGKVVVVEIQNMDELANFTECMNAVKNGRTTIIWNSFILDFTNASSASVDVIEQVLNGFRACMLNAWAC
ncbi:MAG: hypothetical protein J6A25_01095 [Lachnospiraceae bacterium]|nr:hypothetical protein [Lachnospiraceae bacterium]